MAGIDSRAEAETLVRVIDRWFEVRENTSAEPQRDELGDLLDVLALDDIDALAGLEQQVAAELRRLERRRDVIRLRRAACEELEALRPVTDGEALRRSAVEGLRLLGFDTANRTGGMTAWLEHEVESLPDFDGRETGFVVRGRLRLNDRQERKVAFFAPAPASPLSSEQASAPGTILSARASRSGEALVPLDELLRVAAVAMITPHSDPLIGRLREGLAQCVGLYRFEPREAIAPESAGR
jgi:hypothetical protein